MSQMQKIAPFTGSAAIYMLTNSCAKSRWIFSRTEELLIVCCCSSQVHRGKPLVFCRARHEETSSRHAFGRVVQHLLWRRGGCPEARRCSARCQPNNSQQSTATRSSTPQIFCESFTELYKECRGFQLSLLNVLSPWRFYSVSRGFESRGNVKVFTPQCWVISI